MRSAHVVRLRRGTLLQRETMSADHGIQFHDMGLDDRLLQVSQLWRGICGKRYVIIVLLFFRQWPSWGGPDQLLFR